MNFAFSTSSSRASSISGYLTSRDRLSASYRSISPDVFAPKRPVVDARSRLDSGDYMGAQERYDRLRSRYPFSDFATQAQLESIFTRYRSFQPEQALAAADRFMREHPRHEAIP